MDRRACKRAPVAPARLGFAVKVLGQDGLKSNDSRRWQSNPHLRVSIDYLHAIFWYLEKSEIRMYRMSSDLAPYVTHPDLPQFHRQISESRSELVELGRRANQIGLRLSFHPSQFIVMNAPDKTLRRLSVQDLTCQAEILDLMNLGPEAVLVIHVGGTYDDKSAAMDRWVACYQELPEPARRRLVLENDDLRFSSADVLRIHERTGVPLVFDIQHHQCLNPERLSWRPTLERFLRTWPSGRRPKVHYSSPRTQTREVVRVNRKTGKQETCLRPPIWTAHADYIHPFEFIRFLEETQGLEFDVMLEAKAKDLALQRLRQDIAYYAPELQERFGRSALQ
ncbi:MAG: UV DNA damage repair endonuclease UvsE [Acidobacteriaceae bacterium]|nr:UV DNA damage repair endonuclease UvsE [Acidobacteriaceae bacterium]